MTRKAPAKINLSLRVTGKRPDGYHLLATRMQKVALYDTVTLSTCPSGVHLHCTGSTVPADGDNLVWRAAELFLKKTAGRRRGPECGVAIELTKNIPVAAGLGGGSSDAATTLNGLNDLFGCGCSSGELAEWGLQLGADVPFFLAATPAAMATGIGEVLRPVESLQEYSVLLVNPGFPVSTRWVYQNFALTNKVGASNLANSQQGVTEQVVPLYPHRADPATLSLFNDLETVTMARYPSIGHIKEALLHGGAAGALMSGSGPTVFGLFAQRHQAEACLAMYRQHFPFTCLVAPVEDE